jgi:biopolymer transport protein ExbD
MKRIIFILALALFSMNSYGQSTVTPQKVQIDETQFVQLVINTKGKIYVDGKKTSIKNLDKILSDLKKKNGLVKMARDGEYNKKVAATSKEVSALMRKHKIMVKPYVDKTFTKELRF